MWNATEIPRLSQWQNLPLCRGYFSVHIGALRIQERQGGSARDVTGYWVLGTLPDGQFEGLGLWLEPDSGAMSWHSVFDELKARGVEKIRFIVAAEPPTVREAFPDSTGLRIVGRAPRETFEGAPRNLGARANLTTPVLAVGTAAEATVRALSLSSAGRSDTQHGAVERSHGTAPDEILPFIALKPRLRRILVSADEVFQQMHAQLRRVIGRHGCFFDRAAVTVFAMDALSRAERQVGAVRGDVGEVSETAFAAASRNKVAGTEAVCL